MRLRRRSRLARRVAVPALLAGVLLVVAAPSAWAHTELLATTPENGARISTPVDHVAVAFTGAVAPVGDGLTVTRQGEDAPLALPAARPGRDRTTIRVRIAEPLPPGAYIARWTVQSPDGHLLEGTFAFVVAASAAAGRDASNAAGAGAASRPADTDARDRTTTTPARSAQRSAGERGVIDPAASPAELITAGVSDLLVIWTVGSVAFIALVLDGTPAQLAWMGRRTALVGVAAVAAVGGQILTRAALTAGAVPAPSDLAVALTGPFGRAMTARAGGLAVVSIALAWLARQSRDTHADEGAVQWFDPAPPADAGQPASSRLVPLALVPASVGAAAVVVSYAAFGHASTAGNPGLSGVAIAVHVAAVAVWVGGLPWLLGMARRLRGAVDPAVIVVPLSRFAQVAMGALAMVVLSGAVVAVGQLPAVDALWTTPYGRTLAVKLAGVLLLVVLGAINHVVLIPRLRQRPADRRTRRLGRVVAAEIALSVVVIAATALLAHTVPPT